MTQHGMSKDLCVSLPVGKSRKVIYGEGKYIISGDTVILTINNIMGRKTLEDLDKKGDLTNEKRRSKEHDCSPRKRGRREHH